MAVSKLIERAFNWLNANQLKDHLPFVVLVPTILGGIWQIWELKRISVGFIRFFSITQLLSDGLLILFILFFIWLFFLIGSSMVHVRNREAKEKIIDFHKRARRNVYFIFLIAVLFTVTPLFFSGEYFLLEFLVVVFSVGLTVSSIRTLLIQGGLNLFLRRLGRRGNNQLMVSLIKMLLTGSLIFSFILIVNLANKFHESYALPSNFENTKSLKKYVSRKKEIDLKHIEILYFNDRYIFIKTGYLDEILVLEISNLYSEDVLFQD
jgi:hypothetical protein